MRKIRYSVSIRDQHNNEVYLTEVQGYDKRYASKVARKESDKKGITAKGDVFYYIVNELK